MIPENLNVSFGSSDAFQHIRIELAIWCGGPSDFWCATASKTLK